MQCRPQTARVVATNFEVANSKLSRSSPAEKNLVGSPSARSETTSDFQPSMNNSRNQILPPFRSEKHLGPRREARACPMWSGRSRRRLGGSKGVPHRCPNAAADLDRTNGRAGLDLEMVWPCQFCQWSCMDLVLFAFICFQLLADWPQGDKRQVYSAIARAWFLQFRGAKTACESVVNSR